MRKTLVLLCALLILGTAVHAAGLTLRNTGNYLSATWAAGGDFPATDVVRLDVTVTNTERTPMNYILSVTEGTTALLFGGARTEWATGSLAPGASQRHALTTTVEHNANPSAVHNFTAMVSWGFDPDAATSLTWSVTERQLHSYRPRINFGPVLRTPIRGIPLR